MTVQADDGYGASAATGFVINLIDLNIPAAGLPTIEGTAMVGQTLTADTSAIADADGLDDAVFGHQWLADGSDISGATDGTYTPASADRGKIITVRVSFTDDASSAESLTSAATEAVAARPNRPATGLPTISGTAMVGETLTADTSAIADADGLDDAVFGYQWLADGSDISGATDSTYMLASADRGKIITARVSFTDDEGYQETLTSTATSAVVASPNTAATGLPTIYGTAMVGLILTVDTSAIADADGLTNATYAYQWLSGKDTAIQGATSAAYTTAASDEGKAISVAVSFTDDAGHEEMLTSAATEAMAGAATEPTDRPHGLAATVSDGDIVLTWNAPVVDYDVSSYHILRPRPEQREAEPLVYVDQTPNDETTYTDTEVEPGVLYVYWVRAIVNWMGDLGEASYPVEIRMAGTAQQQTANSPATGAPAISGTAQVGETLTAETSGIADEDGLANVIYIYQWQADGADISGAPSSTYTLAEADEGKTIGVWVRFTDNSGNLETLTSAATDAVGGKPNTPAAGTPAISGTAQVGETLTAETSGIADADGLTEVAFSYQWLTSGDTEIQGATDVAYTLAAADLGKIITVRVSFTDDAGHAETLTSEPTAAVAEEPGSPWFGRAP